MEKYCRPPLEKGGIVTVVQGLFEGLEPEQALARRLLVEAGVMSQAEATVFLKKIGPEVAAKLRELSPEELQMACLELKFVAGEAALQGQYYN